MLSTAITEVYILILSYSCMNCYHLSTHATPTHSPDSIPAEIISANPQLKGWGSAFSNFSLQNKILKIYFITTKEAETKMHVANI